MGKQHDRGVLLALAAVVIAGTSLAAGPPGRPNDGVFVRFRLTEPAGQTYYVRVGGYIHNAPWYLPGAVHPAGADVDAGKRIATGAFTPWFDLKTHAGPRLHGRLDRAGGVAEFPNVTAEFVAGGPAPRLSTEIELATAADEKAVVKRWRETIDGPLTSFLVSPQLARDADQLESAAEMTDRRLAWARAATAGKPATPQRLIVQTSFWGPQREELNLREAEVLKLLGFNVVGNQSAAIHERFGFRRPGATHDLDFSPRVTQDEADRAVGKMAKPIQAVAPGAPFNFGDEISAGTIGPDKQALAHFHAGLKEQGILPRDLGVTDLTAVVPIESPDVLRERQKADRRAANRVFYYTSRFRQAATTERLRWLTDAVHRHAPGGPITSTLVADHPYFAGTGLGMGMGPNPAWGRAALAADWFDLARRRAVDLGAIEDWLGLQYMYGPEFTWEGFQLIGFQAAMFRSASGGNLPVMAWITPSDETNLRLKCGSALCQGAKHFFFWTYGPTATSTENYWSDLRGAHDGIAHVTRQLAAAEDVIAPGKPRPARVALLYSISSDLWQPFGYIHMLERRALYLALVHEHHLVDLLTEEDVTGGRLADYAVLYTADPCIARAAADRIGGWVKDGGRLYGTVVAGSRDEFDEPADGMAAVFGVAPVRKVESQSGDYHVRGALNQMPFLDRVEYRTDATAGPTGEHGAIGVRARLTPTTGVPIATFKDGGAAAVENRIGRGTATLVGTCPGIAYVKEAGFWPRELKERWPPALRAVITRAAGGVPRLVVLSHPVVEAGVFDAEAGTALILANFTYEPVERLVVRLAVPRRPTSVRSVEQGTLPFVTEPATEGDPKGFPWVVKFTLKLGLNDVVLTR
jgi:hypothetical protein